MKQRYDDYEGVTKNKYSNTKTEQNLMTAFSAESQARNKYNYYASVAKKEGYEQIMEIFNNTALNEMAHAKIWFKELNGIKTTKENLLSSAAAEHDEYANMYQQFSQTALEEGFTEVSYKFKGVAAIEKHHESVFLELLKNIENEKVFSKEEEIVWECRNCGHLHNGKNAQMVCPVCSHPQSYFEVNCDNF